MLPQKKNFGKRSLIFVIVAVLLLLLVGMGANGRLLRASGISSQPVSPDREAITMTPSSTPTPTGTPTGTAAAAPDYVLISTPVIVSTPPIIGHRPLDVALVVRNEGAASTEPFYVDVYFDLPNTLSNHTLAVTESVGFTAVAGMAAGETRIIHVTTTEGLSNDPNHRVYGMVDSLEQIGEVRENNNIPRPAHVVVTTPGPTAVPSPTPPVGAPEISGTVWRSVTPGWAPQRHAEVRLYDAGGGPPLRLGFTEPDGHYSFGQVSGGNYTVWACVTFLGTQYGGLRTGVTPPNTFADVYMLPGACPTP